MYIAHHMNIYRCESCEYTTNRKANLVRHVNTIHRNVQTCDENKCKYCDREFSNKSNLLRHQSNSCSKYGQMCLNEMLQIHERNVEDDRRNVEDDCQNVEDNCPNVEDEGQSSKKQFPCKDCYKVFATKRSLDRHNCQHISHPLQCPKCMKILASVSAKSHHVKICKVTERPTTSNVTQTTIHTQNNVQGNQQNINIQNMNNINIELRPFGQEDLSHITDEKLHSYLLQLHHGLVLLASDIHLNEDVPQNRNIEVVSSKQGTVRVYSGNNQWDIRARSEAISGIFRNSCDMLTRHFQQHYNIGSCEYQSIYNNLQQMRQVQGAKYTNWAKMFFVRLVNERDKALVNIRK